MAYCENPGTPQRIADDGGKQAPENQIHYAEAWGKLRGKQSLLEWIGGFAVWRSAEARKVAFLWKAILVGGVRRYLRGSGYAYDVVWS
jgi:hypothetical protein